MTITTLPLKTPFTTSLHPWALISKPAITTSNIVTTVTKYLQTVCNGLGMTDLNGRALVVDGRPGPKTMQAVTKLQWAAGITGEVGKVARWTWAVIDEAAYDGWTPAPKTLTRIIVSSKYPEPEPRGPAIYLGCNRYTGLPVDALGISRETAYMSDVGRLAVSRWGDPFVAVDRYMGGTTTGSPHRHGWARDWMTDLDKDGNYREPAEIAACDALADYLAARCLSWPLQTITIRLRGDRARGIDDTSAPLRTKTLRFAGPDRLVKIVWNGRIFEQRNGTLAWWKLNAASDQHRNHVHSETAPIVDRVLLAD